MKQDSIRSSLIEGTIHVIAEDGLDKATTKQISLTTSVNEVYIYRCFKDKADLFSKTFDALDEELAKQVSSNIPIVYMKDLSYETRGRLFFFSIWTFLLGNKEKCLAFVRYYYSPYFTRYSAETHKIRYSDVLDHFKVVFKDEADVWMILNHILNVLLDFAVKVHNNQMSEEDDYAEHVFRVIYRSIEQYFRV